MLGEKKARSNDRAGRLYLLIVVKSSMPNKILSTAYTLNINPIMRTTTAVILVSACRISEFTVDILG